MEHTPGSSHEWWKFIRRKLPGWILQAIFPNEKTSVILSAAFSEKIQKISQSGAKKHQVKPVQLSRVKQPPI